MKKLDLMKRLEKEGYILGGIRPSAKPYQKQFQLVKDLKIQLEFLEAMEMRDNPTPGGEQSK